MKPQGLRPPTLSLSLDLVLLIGCLFHISILLNRPGAPFGLTKSAERLTVTSIRNSLASAPIRPGDVIVSWNGIPISFPEQVQLLTDLSSAGTPATVHFRQNGIDTIATIELINHYSIQHVVFMYVIGVASICVGIFVLIRKPDDANAQILHWALVLMGCVVMRAWEGVTDSLWLTTVNGIHFFGSYLGVASAFFLFTTMFPRPKLGSLAMKMLIIFSPALTLWILLTLHLRNAVISPSPEEFHEYHFWFKALHAFVLICMVGGIVNFVHSYMIAQRTEERKKLKWILWSLCVGPSPFLLLTLLPQLTGGWQGVPEEFTLLFLIIIPIAFAVSIYQHHLLDVDFVISRTTGYAIVLAFLAIVYIGVVSLISSQIPFQKEGAVLAAIVTAFVLEPARRKIQHLIDRTFFRVRYDFRQAQRRFLDRIKESLGIEDMARRIVNETDTLIPVERLGFFQITKPYERIRAVAQKGFDMLEQHGVRFHTAELRTTMSFPITLDENIEAGVPHECGDDNVFKRWGIALVFPLIARSGEVLGFVVLGSKRSGEKFSSEDVDLLQNIALQASLEVERFNLFKDLVQKSAETERLIELNQLKSDFVSYVSHELRTPITSIRMFAELLEARLQYSDKKGHQYLGVIGGEAERLNRMVTTILDSAQLESGTTVYTLEKMDIRTAVDSALETMSYQLRKHGFAVNYRRPKRSLIILADPDAVVGAIINLIGNAIKYSTERKSLTIRVKRDASSVSCSIMDRGMGISRDALPHIFDKFYRDPTHSDFTKGIGLGLPMVKLIAEAHKGIVTAESVIGKGSTFTLKFPSVPK